VLSTGDYPRKVVGHSYVAVGVAVACALYV
jgi:hypothetical protein